MEGVVIKRSWVALEQVRSLNYDDPATPATIDKGKGIIPDQAVCRTRQKTIAVLIDCFLP
ncbi:MAG: hypothetical protein ACOYME_12435 [Prochlorotrichaceae cyanobacterium]